MVQGEDKGKMDNWKCLYINMSNFNMPNFNIILCDSLLQVTRSNNALLPNVVPPLNTC